MAEPLPTFLQKAVIDAALQQERMQPTQLQKYLLEQGFSSEIVVGNARRIWPIYEAKIKQPSNIHQRPINPAAIRTGDLPPTPNSMRPKDMSFAGSSTSSISSSEIIEILPDGVIDKVHHVGCVFDDDCWESIICDSTVERMEIPIKTNNTVCIVWRRKNNYKTNSTICKVIPAEDLECDVKFGTDCAKGVKEQENRTASAQSAQGGSRSNSRLYDENSDDESSNENTELSPKELETLAKLQIAAVRAMSKTMPKAMSKDNPRGRRESDGSRESRGNHR